MAPAVITLNAAVIALTLVVAITTLPAPCTAERIGRCQHATVTVKTTVTSSQDHDDQKAAACSKYNVEVTNHITIEYPSEKTEEVTTQGPTHGSAVCNSDSQSVTTVTTARDIRSDYTKYDGVGYYKLHKSRKPWPEAKRICEEEGAHLVIINSKEEEEIIKKLMYGQYAVSVGFHYRQQGDYYETVLGGPLNSTGYVHWDDSAGPPDFDGECGAMFWTTGKLSNFNCGKEIAFVCEMPA